MGKLFSIDADTKATIQDALDDIIGEFGKVCRLVYPAHAVPCSNCFWDAQNGKSTNRWRTGGPMPFLSGTTCPLCKGNGVRADEISEEIKFKVEWEPRRFWYPLPSLNVRVPHSICQTKGFMTDLPKVVRCDHMVVELPVEPYVQSKFRLLGQPVFPGNIIQGRYWVATWESYGG